MNHQNLILKGAEKLLKNKTIKKIQVEVIEAFKDSYESTLDILKKNNFQIKSKLNRNCLPNKEYKFKGNESYNIVLKEINTDKKFFSVHKSSQLSY